MLRLQTAKLPAAALAILPRLRNEILRWAQNLCNRAAAKLLCSIELMLPLGKHAQFELRCSRPKPGFASFTSVAFLPRKCAVFPKENKHRTGFKPL